MDVNAPWISVAETLPIVVWTADSRGNVNYISRRFATLTGLPTEDVTAQRWPERIHPLDFPSTAQIYRNAMKTGTPFTLEGRLRMADGSYRWIHAAGEPMRDDEGKLISWFGVLLDVEEPHRMVERLRAVGEAAPVIMWSADAQGWVDWYNHRWYDFTGQTAEDAFGWGWQAAHHPDDFAEVMRRWPRSIEKAEPFEMEFRLRARDGSYRWFLSRAEPYRDESGAVVRWYGTNVDIDEQKRALERSKRIAETLQDVFLPSDLPVHPEVRFDAAYIAAERDALVGGDWYDAFDLPDGRIVFSMGDVAGHGLQASVLVGKIRQAIYTLSFKDEDPAQILADTNALLIYQHPDTFVTAIVGFVDRSRTHIVYASAGHPPPIVASEANVYADHAEDSDAPLGVGPGTLYRNRSVPVGPGTLFLLYTDGMTEFDRNIEAAEEKLQAAALELVLDPSIVRGAEAVQKLVLRGSAATDDAAVMVVRFGAFVEPPASPPAERTWRFHSSDAYSAHRSRGEVVAYLRQFYPDESECFAAELIAGELLANTVEHAPGLVEIRIAWSEGNAVMIVRDSGPGIEKHTHDLPADPMSEEGRGLFLIEQLARSVTITALPGFGTEVRVALPLKAQTS